MTAPAPTGLTAIGGQAWRNKGARALAAVHLVDCLGNGVYFGTFALYLRQVVQLQLDPSRRAPRCRQRHGTCGEPWRRPSHRSSRRPRDSDRPLGGDRGHVCGDAGGGRAPGRGRHLRVDRHSSPFLLSGTIRDSDRRQLWLRAARGRAGLRSISWQSRDGRRRGRSRYRIGLPGAARAAVLAGSGRTELLAGRGGASMGRLASRHHREIGDSTTPRDPRAGHGRVRGCYRDRRTAFDVAFDWFSSLDRRGWASSRVDRVGSCGHQHGDGLPLSGTCRIHC